MKTQLRLPLTAVALAMALAVSLPTLASAKSDREGRRGGGGSSEDRGGGQGDQGYSRDSGNGTQGDRGRGHRAPQGDPGGSRGSGGGNRDWRNDGRGGSGSGNGSGSRDGSGSGNRDWRGSGGSDGSRIRAGSRGDVRYRQPGPDWRNEQQWGRSGGSGYRPSYGYGSRSRYGGSGYSYRPRQDYYTSFFRRPRFIYRSGFSIGFVIGRVAPYGCRYYDPYCDIGFRSLDEYYDHAYNEGHPEVILLMDSRGEAIATCAYEDGRWVVDDCY